MIEKENAVDRFLKAFRISLNYISLYSGSHRSFIASVGTLKRELDALLGLLDPVEIGFTPDTLVIAGHTYSAPLHRELARFFHSRKVKSICFQRGITEEELAGVLDKLSIHVKEIFKAGGLVAILGSSYGHFVLQELDYSQLLKEGTSGPEGTDIWNFLLQDVIPEGDEEITEFIGKFESMIPKLRVHNLLDDPKLCENIHKILAHLKQWDGERFTVCTKELLRTVIRDKGAVPDQRLEQLRGFFSDLSPEMLSNVLWENISSDDHFDTQSLELFSRIVEQEKHEQIADILVKNANKDKARILDPGQIKRMRSIFSLKEGEQTSTYIPDIYRRAIMQLSDEQYFSSGFSFERNRIQENYDHILLHFLVNEKDPETLELVAKRITGSWERLTSKADPLFFRMMYDALAAKAGEQGPLADLFFRTRRFLEEGVWVPDFPVELLDLALSMKTSVLGPEVYLQRIFKAGEVSPLVVDQYFRLFPMRLGDFYAAMELRASDFDFMEGLLSCIKTLEQKTALEVLKRVFLAANDLVKIEVIQTMGALDQRDETFLFTQLSEGNYLVKKEVLGVLMRSKDPDLLQRGLALLLQIPNPWGKNNILLEENISVVEESDCRSARALLQKLSRQDLMVFIFSSKVAEHARKVVEKWDAR